jgi:hypothetical protein
MSEGDLIAENEDWLIRVEEAWRVVDRWWTDRPVNRSFLTLRAPNGCAVAVCWDGENETWSLVEES